AGHRRVRRGFDTQRAAAEHSVDHAVAELDAADPGHRNVDAGPFDHTLADDQPFGGDDEVGGTPADTRGQYSPEHQYQCETPDRDQCDLAPRLVQPIGQHGEPATAAEDHGEHDDGADQHFAVRVTVHPDLLTLAEQFVRVGHGYSPSSSRKWTTSPANTVRRSPLTS